MQVEGHPQPSGNSNVPGGPIVTIEDPARMNLLGLLLQGSLIQRLSCPRAAKKARRLRGDFGLRISDMAATLSFSAHQITIHKGITPRARAVVRGSMDEMLPLVIKGSLVAAAVAVLEGRISISGNVFALLGLLPILLGKPSPGRRRDA